MHARPIPVQTKVHFKKLQFLAVAYDMDAFSCAFDVVKTVVCFFPLFKQFLRTKMTCSQTIIFQESELMFCVTLKVKSGINQI